MRAPTGLPIPLTDYLGQTEIYWSESAQRFDKIKLMPCPHALRALAKLERMLTFEVLGTPLAQSLKERAEQGVEADATEVPTISGDAKMLRDRRTGQFRGAWAKSQPKRAH